MAMTMDSYDEKAVKTLTVSPGRAVIAAERCREASPNAWPTLTAWQRAYEGVDEAEWGGPSERVAVTRGSRLERFPVAVAAAYMLCPMAGVRERPSQAFVEAACRGLPTHLPRASTEPVWMAKANPQGRHHRFTVTELLLAGAAQYGDERLMVRTLEGLSASDKKWRARLTEQWYGDEPRVLYAPTPRLGGDPALWSRANEAALGSLQRLTRAQAYAYIEASLIANVAPSERLARRVLAAGVTLDGLAPRGSVDRRTLREWLEEFSDSDQPHVANVWRHAVVSQELEPIGHSAALAPTL